MLWYKRILPFILSFASAALIILSFPDANLSYFIWLSLLPLLAAVSDASPLRSFGFGILTGVLANCGIFYWIYITIDANTGSAAQSLASLLALSLYLSIMGPGIWVYVIKKTCLKQSSLLFPAFASVLWVSLEYARTYFITGFPWALFGYSQWNFLPIVQSAQYWGVFGVSFLIVLFNTSLFQFFKTKRTASLLFSCALTAFVTVYGYITLNSKHASRLPSVKVAVIQGNIDQYKKWDSLYATEIINTYSYLALGAARHHPDLIIWPETAVPGYLPYDPHLLEWVKKIARETGAYNLIGTPYYSEETRDLYHNSSFLITPEGEITGWHNKTHLVPFGEFVPLRRVFEPYFGILHTLGDFTRGKSPTVLKAGSVRIGPTICSENFFGHLVAGFVRKGAQVLVNQTNDAWFFKTSAAQQHFIMNVFRAVENNRPVIVCGNTGITGSIAPTGKVTGTLPLFKTDTAVTDIFPQNSITFYTKHGDLFAIMCLIAAILILLQRTIKCSKT